MLISEACPGYFGDHGTVGTVQPNLGLDKVFGVLEEEVEFMPDIAHRDRFCFEGLNLICGGFLQSYRTTSGKAHGTFKDGRLAVVENEFGKGATLIIGSHRVFHILTMPQPIAAPTSERFLIGRISHLNLKSQIGMFKLVCIRAIHGICG